MEIQIQHNSNIDVNIQNNSNRMHMNLRVIDPNTIEHQVDDNTDGVFRTPSTPRSTRLWHNFDISILVELFNLSEIVLRICNVNVWILFFLCSPNSNYYIIKIYFWVQIETSLSPYLIIINTIWKNLEYSPWLCNFQREGKNFEFDSLREFNHGRWNRGN